MDPGSVLLALALTVLVTAFVARPLIEGRLHPDTDPASPQDSLLTQREAVLTELRELDFDHATGKVDDNDYAAQRARLLAHGAEILRALDQAPAPGRDKAPALDEEIERLVAARRRGAPKPGAVPRSSGGSHFCSQCGRALRPDDKFCASCGAKVLLTEAVQ